ncbi:MAG: tRNA (N6-isopentenyl adenosine(37)-C2)-methylthiotransferase MiaB [Defluviitaleaceae bacterium]|nr:tRNA (N6-isopentenyl adenosine(37)-C2)-methylthiotransferase MiaB [Defluviitaleaceae bacterium]
MMQDYRYLIQSYNDEIKKREGQPLRFFVRTYGCQMNSRDSEKLAALLGVLGYEEAASQADADFILFNTCCVRESAEDRVFGHIGQAKRLRRAKPGLVIAVAGCMTQQEEMTDIFRQKYRYVNIVFGTANRHRLPEFIWQNLQTGKQVIDITGLDDENELPELDGIPVTTREFPHKAGVNIMFGCDNFCSYCIVPYVRGREKSRAAGDILQEVEALAADGVKEIMLLGQNVNSYAGGFVPLLERINAVPGLQRIRFMTSHPKDLSPELINAVACLPKLCKHVHLPMQSGSSKVLADMNRKYTKEEYLTVALRLKSAGVTLTTDIIVGYPGETEEDFEHTLDVIRKVRFGGAFTFMYSKRSGTPAAERTDNIPRKTIADRFDRLTEEIARIMLEINQTQIGSTLDVMVEETRDGAYKGRADDHSLVHFTSEMPLQQGDITQVRISEVKSFYLQGATE